MSFVRVPGNPEPEGAQELWLEGRGGVRLRALFAPSTGGPARGSVLLCSGYTEFIEKYFETIRDLQRRGFVVFMMDWRGQGMSDRPFPQQPLKAHIDTLDDPVQDLVDAIARMGDRLPQPHVLLAHSMGGGITLRGLQTRRFTVQGAMFCAPMWGIPRLGKAARRFARTMTSIGFGGLWAPGVATKWRKDNFKRNPVTHDKERFARAQALVLAEPRLALAGPTLGWLNAAADAVEGFTRPSALVHLRMPVVVLSAAEEQLVDNDAHEVVTNLLPNARREIIEGARHEILMEIDAIRARALAQFDRLSDEVAPRRSATTQTVH